MARGETRTGLAPTGPRSALVFACVWLFTTASCHTSLSGCNWTVGVYNDSAPFVFVASGKLVGFDIDVVTALLGPTLLNASSVNFVSFHSFKSLLKATADGEVDLAASAIAVSHSLDNEVYLTSPYFFGGLQILVDVGVAPQAFFHALMSPLVLLLVCCYLIGLVLFAHLMWLAERRDNAAFRRGYAGGVGDGVWWASITVLIGGLGDKVPMSRCGRVIGVSATAFGVLATALLISALSSSLSSAMTSPPVRQLSELTDRRVGVVRGHYSSSYVRANLAAELISYATLEAAMAALESGQIDAIVDNSYTLLYTLSTLASGTSLALAGQVFEPQRFALALPLNSTRAHDVNEALDTLLESLVSNAIYQKWFRQSKGSAASTASGLSSRTHVSVWMGRVALWTAVSLVGATLALCLADTTRAWRQTRVASGESEAWPLLGPGPGAPPNAAAEVVLLRREVAELRALVHNERDKSRIN